MSYMNSNLSGIEVAICLADMVKHTLGTRNRIKCVVDGNDDIFVKDTGLLLQSLDIEHPVGQYIMSVCKSFHMLHGTGTKSLLFMIGAFMRSALVLRSKGIPLSILTQHLRKCVEICQAEMEDIRISLQAELDCYVEDYKKDNHTKFDVTVSAEKCSDSTEKQNVTTNVEESSVLDLELSPLQNAFVNLTEKSFPNPASIKSENMSTEAGVLQGNKHSDIESCDGVHLKLTNQKIEIDDNDVDWFFDDDQSNEDMSMKQYKTVVEIDSEIYLTKSSPEHRATSCKNSHVISDSQSDSEFDDCFDDVPTIVKFDFASNSNKIDPKNNPALGKLGEIFTFHESSALQRESISSVNKSKKTDFYGTSRLDDFDSNFDGEFNKTVEPVSLLQNASASDKVSTVSKNSVDIPASSELPPLCTRLDNEIFEYSNSSEHKENKQASQCNRSKTENVAIYGKTKSDVCLATVDDLLRNLNKTKSKLTSSSKVFNSSRHFKTIDSTLQEMQTDIMPGNLKNKSPLVTNSCSDVTDSSESTISRPSVDKLMKNLNIAKPVKTASRILNSSRHFKTIDSTFEDIKSQRQMDRKTYELEISREFHNFSDKEFESGHLKKDDNDMKSETQLKSADLKYVKADYATSRYLYSKDLKHVATSTIQHSPASEKMEKEFVNNPIKKPGSNFVNSVFDLNSTNDKKVMSKRNSLVKSRHFQNDFRTDNAKLEIYEKGMISHGICSDDVKTDDPDSYSIDIERSFQMEKSETAKEMESMDRELTFADCLKSLRQFALYLSHGDSVAMETVFETLIGQWDEKMDTVINKIRLEVSQLHFCTILGPLSVKPQVFKGLVLPVNSTTMSQLKVDKQLRTLMINGDISPKFHHTGYKKTVDSQTIHIWDEEISSVCRGSNWISDIQNVLKQYFVELLLVRGTVSEDVKVMCESCDVVVMETVPYKALQTICCSSNKSMAVYITDICEVYSGWTRAVQDQICCLRTWYAAGAEYHTHQPLVSIKPEDNICDAIRMRCYHEDWMLKKNDSLHVVIECEPSLLQTVVYTHPTQHGCELMDQEFWRCANLLSSALKSGYILPGGGLTESKCAEYLRLEAEKRLRNVDEVCGPDDLYFITVLEGISEAFLEYRRNILLNSPTPKDPETTSSGPLSQNFCMSDSVDFSSDISNKDTKYEKISDESSKHGSLLNNEQLGDVNNVLNDFKEKCICTETLVQYDDYKSKLNSWTTAINTVITVLQTDTYITTGVTGEMKKLLKYKSDVIL